MIKSIGQPISSALEATKLREGGKTRGTTAVLASTSNAIGVSASPAARMASEGAPVDMDRIAKIKAAIASGDYPVDPAAIAEKMVALDLRPVG